MTVHHPLDLLYGAVVIVTYPLGTRVGHRVFDPHFESRLSDDERCRRRAAVRLRERRFLVGLWAVCIIVTLAFAIG